MEKVQKNIVPQNSVGKNLISASKILEITLLDWHDSRKVSEGSKDTKLKINDNILKQSNNNNENVSTKINEVRQEGKIENLIDLTFEFIKERELEGFFEHLMQSYSFDEKEASKVLSVLNSIKEKVETKLSLLIRYIFNDSKSEFYECLRITQDTEDMKQLFEHLCEVKNEILKHNEVEIPESLLENFAQSLLSTNKLIDQINKLILKHFG